MVVYDLHTTAPLAFLAGSFDSTGSIRASLIAALGAVIAAGLPVVAVLFKRSSQREATPPSGSESVIDTLRSELVRVNARNAGLERTVDIQRERIDSLETLCWRAGIDPTADHREDEHEPPKP